MDEIFKNIFNILPNNEAYIDKITNKLNIEQPNLNIVQIIPDGKCYFRCVSQFLYQNESQYNLIRMAIYTYAVSYIEEICAFQPNVEINPNVYLPTKAYIKQMCNNKEWAGDIEIILTSYIFGIHIAVYRDYYINHKNEKVYDNLYHYIFDIKQEIGNDKNNLLMILLHENNNHYNLLYFNSDLEEDMSELKSATSNINASKKKEKVNKDNILSRNKNINIDISNSYDNYRDNYHTNYESVNNNDNKIIISKKINIIDSTVADNSKENLKSTLINQFPNYTLGEDKNFYFNVYLFLKNGIKNKKLTWPDYIENEKDKNIRNIKKIEFYKKIGRIGLGYGKNKLMNKDNTNIKKFEIINDNLYNNRIINDPVTNNKIVKKFRIPKSKEINDILFKSHNQRNHCGIYGTHYYIIQNNIYWINIIEDIKNHINKCLTCNKIKKINKNSKIPSKNILSKGPRDRYVADLWYLPPELNSKYTSYKYVLNIIDNFSKFTQSYLLNSKEEYEIMKYSL